MPASTSSTSAGSWPGWSDLAVLLLRRAPARRRSWPPATSPGRRFPPHRHGAALRAMSVGLRMAADVEGRRPGPQPHLVRQLRRAPGQAPLRHPARGDHPQPGAAATLEGRAARRRLRAVLVLRADRDRQRRRGHRRVGRDAPTTSCGPTRPSTRRGSTSSTTASTRTSTGPTPRPTWSSASAIDPSRPSVMFVGRITRQKGIATCSTPPSCSTPPPS